MSNEELIMLDNNDEEIMQLNSKIFLEDRLPLFQDGSVDKERFNHMVENKYFVKNKLLSFEEFDLNVIPRQFNIFL